MIEQYLQTSKLVIDLIDRDTLSRVIDVCANLRSHGRLFIIGVGGSAANASHAVNDFRKLCGIESYTPVDNVSELTARTNDDGFRTVFSEWLKVSNINSNDVLLVLSVGGGNEEKAVSTNIIDAITVAKQVDAGVIGIVGKDGGYTKQHADLCILVPEIDKDFVTPLTESLQVLLLHLIVWAIKVKPSKW